jgi:hypothetical protein
MTQRDTDTASDSDQELMLPLVFGIAAAQAVSTCPTWLIVAHGVTVVITNHGRDRVGVPETPGISADISNHETMPH